MNGAARLIAHSIARNAQRGRITLKQAQNGLRALVPPRGADALRNRAAVEIGVPETFLRPLNDFFRELEERLKNHTGDNAMDLLTISEAAAKRLPELFQHMDRAALAKVFEAAMGDAVVKEAKQSVKK